MKSDRSVWRKKKETWETLLLSHLHVPGQLLREVGVLVGLWISDTDPQFQHRTGVREGYWNLRLSLCFTHTRAFKVKSSNVCLCVCSYFCFWRNAFPNCFRLENGQFFQTLNIDTKILAFGNFTLKFIGISLHTAIKIKSWVVRHKTLCALLKPRPPPAVVKQW